MWWRTRPLILVIGSAHLDVLGDFRRAERKRVDREGEVFCSIGGTGFNMAVNLANEGGVVVRLYTHVREKSPISKIIVMRLREEGVETRYVFADPKIDRDSGFVAHRADGELVSAVSSMPVECVGFDEKVLASAIRHASVVMAECNLSALQLAQVMSLVSAHKKKLVVGGVSETKCQRIRDAIKVDPTVRPLSAFVVNLKEASALVGGKFDTSSEADGRNICAVANSDAVVVTTGSSGWIVCHAGGLLERFQAPNVPSVNSTSGAGDALTAAIAHDLALHGSTDWARLKEKIHRFVTSVLKKKVASGADLTSLETLGVAYKQGILDRIQGSKVTFGAVVVGATTLFLTFIQAAVSLETSTKVWTYMVKPYCWVRPASDICVKAKPDTTPLR